MGKGIYVGANMDYESMLMLFRASLYLSAFVVFIVVVKFVLKKHLDYSRVAIAGLIIGIVVFSLFFIITWITYNPDNPNYTLELYMDAPGVAAGSIMAEGVITMVAFIVLSAITKSVYNKLRKT